MIDDCPPPPSPPDEPETPSEGCDKLWHISTIGASNTCTNDDQYPPVWMSNPNIKVNSTYGSDIVAVLLHLH